MKILYIDEMPRFMLNAYHLHHDSWTDAHLYVVKMQEDKKFLQVLSGILKSATYLLDAMMIYADLGGNGNKLSITPYQSAMTLPHTTQDKMPWQCRHTPKPESTPIYRKHAAD